MAQVCFRFQAESVEYGGYDPDVFGDWPGGTTFGCGLIWVVV